MNPQVIQGIDESSNEWLSGEEIEQIQVPFDMIFQRQSPFPDIRLITTSKITPEIIKELESNSPYEKNGTQEISEEDIKYSKIISTSITENLCDKFAAPHFIHNFEICSLPDPFPEEKAAPLSQNTKVENELLDDPEFIH